MTSAIPTAGDEIGPAEDTPTTEAATPSEPAVIAPRAANCVVQATVPEAA